MACWNTKISYSSLNSPTSISIFLPGISLLPFVGAALPDCIRPPAAAQGRPSSPVVKTGALAWAGVRGLPTGRPGNKTVIGTNAPMRRLLPFVFLSLLLLGKLACSGASSGGHSAEIDTVQHALVVNVARSGLKSSVSVAGWIKQQFYIGRFDVRWSADDNAGQIRVNANMQSQSVTKLERSIVLRFNVDPQDKSVVF